MIPVFKAVFAGKNASLTVVPLAPFWGRLYTGPDIFGGGAIIKSIPISNKNESKNAHAA